MSSYRTMDQGLPPYSQPSSGYQQQPGSLPSRALQRNPAPPRARHDEGSGDWDKAILGPGEFDIEALNLDFDKCFYEHESTKTIPELFTIVGLIYKYVKLAMYHFFVFFFGIPMAVFWAMFNGFMVFLYIWLYQPLLRLWTMWMYALAPLASVPLQAFFAPIVDVSGRIFRQIRVKATLDGPFAERLAGQARATNSV